MKKCNIFWPISAWFSFYSFNNISNSKIQESLSFEPNYGEKVFKNVAKFVHWCKKESTKDQGEEPVDSKTREKKKKYLRLLRKLITIKQNKEVEMTKEDSFTDLRKDLKQDMTKEIQDMKLDIQKILEKIDQLAKKD